MADEIELQLNDDDGITTVYDVLLHGTVRGHIRVSKVTDPAFYSALGLTIPPPSGVTFISSTRILSDAKASLQGAWFQMPTADEAKKRALEWVRESLTKSSDSN